MPAPAHPAWVRWQWRDGTAPWECHDPAAALMADPPRADESRSHGCGEPSPAPHHGRPWLRGRGRASPASRPESHRRLLLKAPSTPGRRDPHGGDYTVGHGPPLRVSHPMPPQRTSPAVRDDGSCVIFILLLDVPTPFMQTALPRAAEPQCMCSHLT